MTLSEAAERLSLAGVDSPLHDARELFYHFGGFSRSTLITKATECDLPELISAIDRRCNREPLQYILGYADFYRERYTVSPDCLIPRSDTELLVDYAVKNLPEGKTLLDLCTGSGCVALSTLNNTRNTYAVAVDISAAALNIAKENATSLGLTDRISLRRADVLKEKAEGDFFALLSNPPYVSEDAYRGLDEEIYKEPRNAFLGGKDGGDFYRHILPTYREIAEKGGFIAFEIGFDQAELLRSLAESEGLACEILRDLSGNDRVAVIRRS